MDNYWSRARAALRNTGVWRTPPRKFEYEAILRSELFSAEQMAGHGTFLAQHHTLSPRSGKDTLLARLADNELTLANSCAVLISEQPTSRRVTPAAEWLLDNYYLVEEHIRIAKTHLPKGYSRELPRLANGVSSGLPRVYDIALETIAHGDGRVDVDSLSRFVEAYQSVTSLALGELWAIPIMLRLALIENLRRVASRVMASWADRNLANDWADRLRETAGRDAKSVVLVLADMARSQPPMTAAFVAELARRLQGQSAALIQPLTWVEQMLAESGLSIERQVQLDAQQQAADQVSVSHSITSLRLLATSDWREFVERMSHVERLLRSDPAGVYPAMDFASRDHYRHVIERLARHSTQPQDAIARAAIELAAAAGLPPHEAAAPAHVGFYLIGAGLAQLETRIHAGVPFSERWQRLLHRAPLAFFLGPVLLLTLGFSAPLLYATLRDGWPLAVLLGLALPTLVMTSRLAIDLVNWLVTLSVTPGLLPRLDFSEGLPVQARTLVVIPTLMANAADVEELVEGLEVRFLANRDDHLHFALLTDFLDAASETLPEDAALMTLAGSLIEGLNHKYPDAARFVLLHRPRRWNPVDHVWMGFERKRGKLADLNALLRGHGEQRFTLRVGDIEVLRGVRYVITLDTDTQLPRNAARQFVGAMEHPLNRAQATAQPGQADSGYAILQPRVGISLPSAARSVYARLFGSDAGVDPYTRAVSDVYQDLFEQGSFIGKGIYAVDAFEQALQGCLPDNRILSHDLIEGCYARSGLLSDVQVFEEYPARYSADVKRRHRWIRGDWQLLPWVLPWAPTAAGHYARNRLAALARWKLFDNLRRSLEPGALLCMLLWGWLASGRPALWTLAALLLILTHAVLGTLLEMLRKPVDVPLAQHLWAAVRGCALHFARAGLHLAWLPFEAYYSLDAIVRTLWRMLVSKRRLLQWSPSREVERGSVNRLGGLYRTMWSAPALALGVAAWLLTNPATLAMAAPLLLLWLVSPALAWWISRPSARARFDPTAEDLRFLRGLARQTWAFFEQHVGPADNWLPPDNVQELPVASIAHRTSPTNMGMALLGHLAAHDFGYLGTGLLLERLQHMLDSMEGLVRHQRHFYNWYDTVTLKPLPPLYVSTVDSGNLAGLLLTLKPGLLELADAPLHDLRVAQGLLDTLEVFRDALGTAGLPDTDAQSLCRRLRATQVDSITPANLLDLLQTALDLPAPAAADDSEARFWFDSLQRQCMAQRDEVQRFTLPAVTDASVQPHTRCWRDLAQLDAAAWPAADRPRVLQVQALARQRIQQAAQLADRVEAMADMDFSFLYDARRELFVIGYNADERRLDTAFYDLLASEVRLTSFVVIAQGQVPQESWFSLGRLLTSNAGVPVLLSWSGSMFEYLMPMLVMPSYEGTLLDQTCQAAVARQIEHASQLGTPWGVSESGYNTFDAHFNYQYRAFGVPGLGLKRGLGEDNVVAPYASALALMVAPTAACHNLRRLARQGLAGRFGLYEAVDYTPARLPPGADSAVVRSFMAHHQGMSLLALTSLLLEQPMQRRFAAEPAFQACALLLQERVPKSATQYLHAAQAPTLDDASQGNETKLRVFTDPDRRRPAVQLLSNGRYHVMVSNAGGGYSRCNDMAVTRWREDIASDSLGTFCYLRDVASGRFWSTAYQPTLHRAHSQETVFTDARAEFRVRELNFDCHTEIVVSPEDDIELRRLHLTNRARTRRTLELTSYAEVVLASAISDALHPAFSKLFVQTELVRPLQAILCSRRPRASDEPVPWMCHLLAAHGVDIDHISYETDRARFIGRGRSLVAPAALDERCERLSGTAGAVLDPIVSIRCRITLEPGQSATLDLVSGVADSREACLHLIDKYRDRHLADRVFDLAWTHSQVLLRQLNASMADARLFEQMAASILYANPTLRAESNVLASNRRSQSGLWGQAISGDLPIVLVQIADPANIELVQQMVQAHAYWRQKGLILDLVIWNEDQAGYRQQLQDLIMGLVTSGVEAALLDRPGGIFVRPAQQLSSEDRTLMLSVARLMLSDSHGSLAEQVHRRRIETALAPFTPSLSSAPQSAGYLLEPLPMAPTLGNAYGGFSADGHEYIINHRPGQPTPAPWVNVLANPQFGSIVSETGGAYSWYENAHEFRLSPWHNDPVSDPSGEVLYLRDEDSGEVWSPTPAPCPGTGTYRTRHGFGYSVFEHVQDDVHSELWVYVALDAPVKFSRLVLRNTGSRTRRLSATCYVEWVLGDLRSKSAMHVVTEADPFSGALFARNAYSIEFSGRVGFLDCDSLQASLSGDRVEFLGRNGTLAAPAALRRARLSGRTGGGMDPCGALQVAVELLPGESREVVFRLGAEQDAKSATRRVQQYRGTRAASVELDRVREHWRTTLGSLSVHTPEPALDVLVNGWLMYQVISCRFYARSGYYQSGGAFGFRDQLQDSMAMVHADPASSRAHLLLCARHQYVQGDVQHWWHPPMDRGVRTRCSDDMLWLALATSRYVELTGDVAVLDETVGYLEGRALNAGEESYYDLPGRSTLEETLYQHCQRALEHGLAVGSHGLPLMGSGDWNDGMNKVGEQGVGESVWLGFFAHEVLRQFAATAQRHGDTRYAQRCGEQAALLRDNLQAHGWDGAWYRRAYFDNGQPLGSAGNQECRIDSIAQSWSVLSGAAPVEHCHSAMAALDRYLVRRDVGIVLLLDPPFDKGTLDPGYIKGYVPGVRENGGQYTHAAVWASMAFARLGDSARAWELMRMISPQSQGRAARIDTYKVEPYVMAADVYGVAPHAGRGGWSWYTGAAGWMYRLIVESLLGVQRKGNTLMLQPLLPPEWPGFTLHYRYGGSVYHIDVRQGAGAEHVLSVDDQVIEGSSLTLVDDGGEHQVALLCAEPVYAPLRG